MKDLQIEYIDVNRLEPYERNSRKHDRRDIESIKASITEFGFSDPIGIWSDHNVIVEGHGRLEAAKELGMVKVPCIRLDHMTDEQRRAYAIAHNKVAELSEWDFRVLDSELAGITEIDMGQFGFYETEEQELERKKKDFEDRMASGELSDDSEEYQEFLAKFEAKKTTDDCYTPPIVYEAVADYVERTYGVKKKHFVRPFVPGGDYEHFDYPAGCVVVDNPPFSILAEILAFYKEKGIEFFLFAPGLTCLSSASSSSSCVLCTGVDVIYENGAIVNTSFCTSFDAGKVRLKSAPELYKVVDEAAQKAAKENKVELPKYSYPDEIVSAAMVNRYSKYGVDFSVPVAESYPCSALDAQKEAGKAIFGKGYLLSERAAAERAAATKWSLSEREWGIVKSLGQ
jgi:hypothetical protein